MNANIIKQPINELYKEQQGKYPHFEKPILKWLHYRIENYLTNNTERI